MQVDYYQSIIDFLPQTLLSSSWHQPWKVGMRNLPLISVVDDDDSVRESLQRLIRSVGFAVKETGIVTWRALGAR
jgi:hypothetical protein